VSAPLYDVSADGRHQGHPRRRRFGKSMIYVNEDKRGHASLLAMPGSNRDLPSRPYQAGGDASRGRVDGAVARDLLAKVQALPQVSRPGAGVLGRANLPRRSSPGRSGCFRASCSGRAPC